MNNKLKYLFLILFLLLIIPQTALAVWWNPFSWFDNWSFTNESDVRDRSQENSVDVSSNTPVKALDNQSEDTVSTNVPDSVPPIFEPPVIENIPTPVPATNNAPVIKNIQAKASSDGVIYAGEKASIHGTGLSGSLTIKLGNIEPKYVNITGTSDTYAEFVVPSYSQPIVVTVTATNSSGKASNFYGINIKTPTDNIGPVIESIQAKASSDGVIYSNEKAYVYGSGLSGDLTIKLGNIEPKYVYVSSISDTSIQFDVPSYNQKTYLSITITNSFGMTSNFYEVQINSPSITFSITNPQSNHSLTRNTNFPVKWSTTGIPISASTYIEIVIVGIKYRVAQDIANTGEYDLFIGKDINGAIIPSGEGSMKVCSTLSGTSYCDIVGPIYITNKG